MLAYVPELSKGNSTRAVRVEHADHHAHRVRVEAGEVAVDECAAELALRQLAAAFLVDGLEKGEQRGVFVHPSSPSAGPGRRCRRWPRGWWRPVVRVRGPRAEAVVGGRRRVAVVEGGVVVVVTAAGGGPAAGVVNGGWVGVVVGSCVGRTWGGLWWFSRWGFVLVGCWGLLVG